MLSQDRQTILSEIRGREERPQGHTVSYFNIRREPLSLVNVRKRSLESGDDDLPNRMDHYKAKATRHIFLIRHSQYHVDASLEKDRTLTPLGTWRGLTPTDPRGRSP